MRRLSEISPRLMEEALHALLSPAQTRLLEAWAPPAVQLPNGTRVRVDYGGEAPSVSARLQEFFGCRETPRIAGSRVPLTIRLLSPAGRPVQVTADLAGFWRGSYREVRKELRGCYPKHPWPEDPLQAVLPSKRGLSRSRLR